MGEPLSSSFANSFKVSLTQTGESYSCRAGESLLQSMIRLGRRGIPAGCVNGGCGVCKIKVTQGRCQLLGPVSRAHVSVEEEADGVFLACRAAPETDVEVEIIGKMQRGFLSQIARPASVSG